MFAAARNQQLTRVRLAAAAVLGFSAALFFFDLGERSLWSEEVRWAEIPREMQRAGNYFRPTFNGRVYYDKPLGSYWLVLAAAHITGGIDELSARLPSAISAWMAVVLVMLIARRHYDGETAVLAGAILATSFGFTGFARTASADAETVAGVLAALWLFARNDGRAGPWLYWFWIVMALTSLTKGLLGFVLPLLVTGVFSTWRGFDTPPRDSPDAKWANAFDWLINRTTLIAAPIAIAVYFVPFLLSGGGGIEGINMVFRENIRRFYDPVNHRGPRYLYAYVILELMAPWSVFLPAALMRVRRADRFALAFFWAVFVFFTLSASRRSYYLLPILPAAALLVGSALVQPSRLRTIGVWLFSLTVLLAPIALASPAMRPSPLDELPASPTPTAFVAAWTISVAALAITIMRRRHIAAALVVAAFSFQVYLFVFALPAIDVYRGQRPFAAAVREQIGADFTGLALYRTADIVYYLDPPAPLPDFHEPTDLQPAVASGSVRWLIVRRRDRDALGADWTDAAAETVQPWEDKSQAETRLLLLRATR